MRKASALIASAVVRVRQGVIWHGACCGRFLTLHYVTGSAGALSGAVGHHAGFRERPDITYITLHYITLHYITSHCIILHYITSQDRLPPPPVLWGLTLAFVSDLLERAHGTPLTGPRAADLGGGRQFDTANSITPI